MANRKERDRLAVVIRALLDGAVAPYDFHGELSLLRDSKDSVVEYLTRLVQIYCVDDPRGVMTREAWGILHRFLLLLESDNDIRVVSTRIWSWTQLCALMALAGFICCAATFGVGPYLLVAAIPFGVVSIRISKIRERKYFGEPYFRILWPFSTFSELANAYEGTGFQKIRCSQNVTSQRKQRDASECPMWLYGCWLLLSPIPLMIQLIPIRREETKVMAV